MTNGIILAGGRGSRLGPLAAQISKALVSIGQRPHLAHQVELLKRNGCDRIIVVTSPDTHRQVTDMLHRSGLASYHDVITTPQMKPLGPVDAIRVGLEAADVNRPSFVLMSDTYIDEDFPQTGTWVGVGDAPYTRSFCFPSGDGFVDGTASPGKNVTIGAYRFDDSVAAYTAAAGIVRTHSKQGQVEVGMAPFLTAINANEPMVPIIFRSWLDLGDVKALARARQSKFIARDHHTLDLSKYGTITKTGEGDGFLKQGTWMNDISNDPVTEVANLVPRVYEFGGDGRWYTMEFIDLPTLSELWLYWPGRPDTWGDILQTVIDRMHALWEGDGQSKPYTGPEEYEVYSVKAMERLAQLDAREGTAFAEMLSPMIDAAANLFTDDEQGVRPHGDLNFNNILYSLNTGMVKLVDPRGDDRLPLSYEYAKLRYSYHGGFSAITHGLTHDTNLLPKRFDEQHAMDDVIQRNYYGGLDKLTAAEAMLLFAGAPLHPWNEARVMVGRGKKMLERVV